MITTARVAKIDNKSNGKERIRSPRNRVRAHASPRPRQRRDGNRFLDIIDSWKNIHGSNLEEEDINAEQRMKSIAVSACAAIALVSVSQVEPANAGFGAPTGAVLSPPLNSLPFSEIEKMDFQAKKRYSKITTIDNIDILLQELYALQQLDVQRDLQDDATALKANSIARDIESNLEKFRESNELGEQKQRLLNKRKEEAELVVRLTDRRVALGKLNNQESVIVYGSALAASLIANTTMHPIDTIKVRKITLKAKNKMKMMKEENDDDENVNDNSNNNNNNNSSNRGGQTSSSPSMSFDSSGAAAISWEKSSVSSSNNNDKQLISSYEPSMQEIMGEGGFMSLYDGLGPNLAKEGVPLTLYLGVYETVKLFLLANTQFFNEHVILCYLFAGGCGEFIASIVRVPAEAVKSRTQIGATVPEAIFSNFGSDRGRKNIVRTWQVAVVRDIPFGAIQIALFEFLKLLLTGEENAPFDPNSLLGEAILGACGGIAGSLSVTPFDVLVTRMIQQMESSDQATKDLIAECSVDIDSDCEVTPKMMQENNNSVDGPMEMVRKIYLEGGTNAFWSGAQERVLYWGPAVAIFLSAYCRIRQSFL